MKHLLQIDDLEVAINKTSILNGINLTIDRGQTHTIMGPNGSGKSTLAKAIVGHPKCTVTKGSMLLNGQDLASMSVSQRAQAGIFLAFQTPQEIEGVSLREFLYQVYQAQHKHDGSPDQFEYKLVKCLKLLDIPPAFVERSLNFGFSGGEKKRAEVLQLAMIQPKLAILDEIDSGLDVDALYTVCNGINSVKADNPDMALLIITHYPRILNYLFPDRVHVMNNGKIVKSGEKELADTIEREGFGL